MNKPHAHIYRTENQQVNRRHIKITYSLTAPEPARGPSIGVIFKFFLSPEIVTVKFKDFHGSVAIAVVNSETIQVVDEGRCCSLA